MREGLGVEGVDGVDFLGVVDTMTDVLIIETVFGPAEKRAAEQNVQSVVE